MNSSTAWRARRVTLALARPSSRSTAMGILSSGKMIRMTRVRRSCREYAWAAPPHRPLHPRGGVLGARPADHTPRGTRVRACPGQGVRVDRRHHRRGPRIPRRPLPASGDGGGVGANPRLAKMDGAVARDGWRIVMITRPVPLFSFNLQNYAYGLTRIGFLTSLLAPWICMLPGMAAYTFAGGALSEGGHD